MSFLNSVLSSINNGKTQITAPQVRSPKPDQPGLDKSSTTATPKRKASSELQRANDKAPKSISVSQRAEASSSNRDSRPFSNGASNTVARRPQPAAATVAAAAKAAPKKGSFQEIMARANAAGQIGQLTHKPKTKEQLSMKKELALKKEMAKMGKKGGQGQVQRTGSVHKAAAQATTATTATSSKQVDKVGKNAKGTVYQGTMKPKPQSGYQGTAKSKASAPEYKGTSRGGSDQARKREYDSEPDRNRSKTQSQRKRSYSDVGSEQDESEDGYTYASSDYSDMDAGFDDVDEEEAIAERQAKKEDMWEQRRLEELARQKEQRKKRAIAEAERDRGSRR